MELITLTIDGREMQTEKGKSVLEASLAGGIYIPHLCHHSDLHPIGVCRLCVVEIDGREGLQTSCTTPAEDGMVVRTKGGEIEDARRMAMELMLSGHQADCGSCVKYLNCELQSLKQYLVKDDLRLKRRSRLFGAADTNPIFYHEANKCVLCGRCVRACHELRALASYSTNTATEKPISGSGLTRTEIFRWLRPAAVSAGPAPRFARPARSGIKKNSAREKPVKPRFSPAAIPARRKSMFRITCVLSGKRTLRPPWR